MSSNPIDRPVPALQIHQQHQQIDARLAPFIGVGIRLGLDRMKRLLAALDNPQEKMPLVHVAGTNGKGSVCAYLTSVLTEAGYRVGTYTSPHLVYWTERVQVGRSPISPDEFLTAINAVITAGEAIAQELEDPAAGIPTLYEIVTAAAWWHFAQAGVDIAVMEVGLGGRLDATNVCDRPAATVGGQPSKQSGAGHPTPSCGPTSSSPALLEEFWWITAWEKVR